MVNVKIAIIFVFIIRFTQPPPHSLRAPFYFFLHNSLDDFIDFFSTFFTFSFFAVVFFRSCGVAIIMQ